MAIKAEGTVDPNGNLTVNVNHEDILNAIAKVRNPANGISLVIHVSGSGRASGVKVNLPKVVQETMINNKLLNTIVVVDNPDIEIDMDLPAIKEINAQAKADVNLTATRMDSGKLTGAAKTAIATRPAFDLKVNYGDGQQTETFGQGSVSITIPYTLGAKETAENVCAVYVGEHGPVQWLSNSVYDRGAKTLQFSIKHFPSTAWLTGLMHPGLPTRKTIGQRKTLPLWSAVDCSPEQAPKQVSF